jgi:hypothetical protein
MRRYIWSRGPRRTCSHPLPRPPTQHQTGNNTTSPLGAFGSALAPHQSALLTFDPASRQVPLSSMACAIVFEAAAAANTSNISNIGDSSDQGAPPKPKPCGAAAGEAPRHSTKERRQGGHGAPPPPPSAELFGSVSLLSFAVGVPMALTGATALALGLVGPAKPQPAWRWHRRRRSASGRRGGRPADHRPTPEGLSSSSRLHLPVHRHQQPPRLLLRWWWSLFSSAAAPPAPEEHSEAGLEERRRRRRLKRQEQQRMMAEAFAEETARYGVRAPLLSLGDSSGCADGWGGDADADSSASGSSSGSWDEGLEGVEHDDSDESVRLALKRAKHLRRQLRRPLFVGRHGGERALARYHSGVVERGRSSGTVARNFRFPPVGAPPQLPAIREAEEPAAAAARCCPPVRV